VVRVPPDHGEGLLPATWGVSASVS
jgi:hypothetical protein